MNGPNFRRQCRGHLEASATSVVVEFVYEPSPPGVPVLYVVDSGDFETFVPSRWDDSLIG